jgi:hypothetical protein
MKNRCYNPKDKRYSKWGGRGIKVCQRWLDSYLNFLADMGRKPSSQHSIHRINNDGDYEPENCEWATPIKQAQIRTGRFIKMIIIDGKENSISQHCKINGWPISLFSYHLRQGKDPQVIADYLRARHKLKERLSK